MNMAIWFRTRMPPRCQILLLIATTFVTLPEEVRGAIGDAALDELVERSLAVRVSPSLTMARTT